MASIIAATTSARRCLTIAVQKLDPEYCHRGGTAGRAPSNQRIRSRCCANSNANGTWIMHVTDSVTIDTGSVRAFSLTTTTPTCSVLVPLAADDTYSGSGSAPLIVPAASGVLHNDFNPTGTPITATQVTPPSHAGELPSILMAPSRIPRPRLRGTDSFTYTANGRVELLGHIEPRDRQPDVHSRGASGG